MEKIYLSRDAKDGENVQKLFDCVVAAEMERGLTLEEIQYKYTHGFCGLIAQFVKITMETKLDRKVMVKNVAMDLDSGNSQAKVEHVYVTVKPDVADPTNIFARDYYDVFGKHTQQEMSAEVKNPYFIDQEIIAKYRHITDAFQEERDAFNEITDKCYECIEVEEQTPIQ